MLPHSSREAGTSAWSSDFHGFFVQHVGSLLRFALRRSSRTEAEDLVAEVFLRAYERLPKDLIENTDEARAWLFRVLQNLATSVARRSDTARRKQPLVATPNSVHDDVSLPSEVDHALAMLPDRQRTVLELRFFADLDARTTGLVMGIGDEAVRALTQRALRVLRTRLSPAERQATSWETND